MKTFLLALLLCFGINSFCQLKMKLYNEKIQNGSNVLIDNDEFCPISIKVEFELTNMAASSTERTFVVPAKTKGFSITKLTVINNNKPGGFKTKSVANYGNVTLKQVPGYDYSLPFQKGKTFIVDQGYNGSFSHKNENSIDFTMPIGTEVMAARDGIVVKVVKNNNRNCANISCAEFNNYILIYHSDGTFSEYVHLKQNGVLVNEGDIVKENSLIGYSGQTGWANGPHLHFMVFLPRLTDETRETIPTKFKVNDGRQSEFLKEGMEYIRNY
ncbi:MAG: M23 family metallopeptidase [Phycisphaerales bacterium]